MHNLILLLLLIPLFGAGLCLLGKAFHASTFPKIVSVTTLLCALALTLWLYPAQLEQGRIVYTVGGWDAAVGIQQVFDGMAWMSCLIVFTISLFALLFGIAEDTYSATFYFLFLICVAGMIGVVLAADVFNLFVCLEILGISAYILIAYFQKGHAVLASFKYLMISSLGMAFMLLGILILYQQTGALSLYQAGAHYVSRPLPANMSVAIMAMITGIGVRAAFIPFHTWLPKAHAYAPHPVSAILSGVVIKISFLAIWRILSIFQAVHFQRLFLWIGAATAILAVIWALMQSDCKQLLAWHSISQMGFILAGFGGATALSMTASFTHIINHALFKSLLFLCIGSVIHLTGERNVKKLGNLAGAVPLLWLMFLVGALSIAGIPPFNGFISKKLILISVKTSPLAYSTLWIASVGTAASFIKLSAIFRTRPHQFPSASGNITSCPKLAYAAMITLAVFCLITGIWGGFLIRQISRLLCIDAPKAALTVYSFSGLLKTAVIAGLGVAVYKGVLSQAGQNIIHRLNRIHLNLDTALLLCVAGFVLLSGLVMLW